MGWDRLANPKVNASTVGPDEVRVSAREAAKAARFLVVRIGTNAARKGSFTQVEQRCQIMVGTGDERGQVALASDAANGEFVAKRQKDFSYKLTIKAHAAAGRFNLIFPAFTRPTTIIPMNGGPHVITFEAGPDFLAKA